MTSPACPMGEMIIDDAYAELDRILPDDCQPEIRIVWEPPWKPSMMSEQCRLRLHQEALQREQKPLHQNEIWF